MMEMTKTLKKWLVVISCILVLMMVRRPGKRRYQMNWRTQSRCRDFFEIPSVINRTTPLPYNIEKDRDRYTSPILERVANRYGLIGLTIY